MPVRHAQIYWNPGAVAAATCVTNTAPLTGAEVGNPLTPSFPVLPVGVIPFTFVSATNQVTFDVCNITASPVTVSAGFWGAFLLKLGGEDQ